MINKELFELVRCPRCIDRAIIEGHPADRETGRLVLRDSHAHCQTCGTAYTSLNTDAAAKPGEKPVEVPLDDVGLLPRPGYLDLTPPESFENNTRYLEEEFEHEIDFEHISLPLLGAKVRNDLLRKMLKPGPKDIALEVGCGNGKFCYWNRKRFGQAVGVDAAPLFAHEALDKVSLVRGDARLLPFAPGTFDKVFSLDLLEHLPQEGIAPFFAELNRVTKTGGQVFIFSNTREMGRLAPIMKLERKIGRYFADKGMFDFKRDDLRKSDHIKAIRTFDELEAAITAGGFSLEQKLFWNGVFQGFVDNIIIKFGEYLVRRGVRRRLEKRALAQRNSTVSSRLASGTTGLTTDWADGGGMRSSEQARLENRSAVEHEAEKVASDAEQNASIDLAVRKSLKENISQRRGGVFLFLLVCLTWLMKLDIVLFGRLRTGPYFIVIRKTGAPVLSA